MICEMGVVWFRIGKIVVFCVVLFKDKLIENIIGLFKNIKKIGLIFWNKWYKIIS